MLEVLRAVCSNGNTRTKHAVTALLDEKQLLFAAQNPCKKFLKLNIQCIQYLLLDKWLLIIAYLLLIRQTNNLNIY